MTTREPSDHTLQARARLCIFHGTVVTAEQALGMSDEEITSTFLLEHGAKPTNLLTAGVGPVELKKRGAATARVLRDFGFDALSLCDPLFAHQASLAYGADEVKAAFVVAPVDAVAVAGSEAQHILKISVAEMLAACAGAPTEALAVLKQLPEGISLEGVPVETLLDAGLRQQSLRSCGYTLNHLVAQCGAKSKDLFKLGFTF